MLYGIVKWLISNSGLRKHYFSYTSTMMLPTFFILLSLLVFFDEIKWYSMFDVDLSSIGVFYKSPSLLVAKTFLGDSIVLWVSGLAVTVFFYVNYTSKKIKKDLDKPEENMKLDSPIIIDAEGTEGTRPISMKKQNDELKEFLENALGNEKYVFIVAGSGSGKSTLTREYTHRLNNVSESPNAVVRIEDYNLTTQVREDIDDILEKGDGVRKSTIIFDQFEVTLKNKEHEKWVSKCKEKKPLAASFVFVCKKESFSDVLRTYELKPEEYVVYFLLPLSDDKEHFEETWFSTVVRPESEKAKQFHENLFKGFFDGTIRFIEMNIVRSYLRSVKNPDKDKVLIADIYPPKTTTDAAVKKIIELYFDALFRASKNPTAAMTMMYSLCYSGQLTKNKTLNINNFKDLTFEDETVLEDIVKLFKNQNLIQKTTELARPNYRVAHEYLFRHVEVYCEEKLHAQILSNIRIYCNEMNDAPAIDVSTCYAVYQRGDAKSRVRLMPTVIPALSLVLLAASVFLLYRDERNFSFEPISSPVLAWLFNNGTEATVDRVGWLPETSYAFAIVAIGGSICYIYQYMERFARIFLKWKNRLSVRSFFLAWSLIIWGFIACVFAMLWSDWGIAFLASEFILIGCLHIALQHSCHPNATAQFKDEGLTFIGIGIVFLLMNCFIHSANQAMHTWYAVYSLFMLFSVHNHIKTDYLVAKLGSFSTEKAWGKGKKTV